MENLPAAQGVGPAGLHHMLVFVSPAYEDVALNELRDVAGARLVRAVARGVMLASTSQGPEQTEESFAQRPPIFARQVLVDVQAVARTDDVAEDARSIAELISDTPASSIAACDMEGRCHAGLEALREAVAKHLRGERSFDRLLLAAAPGEYFVGRVLPGAGIAPVPFWPAGRPETPSEQHFISRSALKLCEAFDLFAVHLVKGARVLDLGAAPGGWTQVLAGHGMRVTAVDPGELDPRVAALPGVRSFRGTAQAFTRAGTEQFDAVVDDMRLDARESARLLVALRHRLRFGAIVLATLKLPERAPSPVLKSALATLGAGYTVLGKRCLYFNRNEVTVYARVSEDGPRCDLRYTGSGQA